MSFLPEKETKALAKHRCATFAGSPLFCKGLCTLRGFLKFEWVSSYLGLHKCSSCICCLFPREGRLRRPWLYSHY
jgi:hypothetical protein